MATSRGARPTALRYLETSALVAAAIENDAAALASISADGVLVASALTFAEARRATVVGRTTGRFDADAERTIGATLAECESRCDIVQITPDILRRLGRPFPVEPVRAPDAIHLASVESLDEDPRNVIVVTRDKRIQENARALGYAVE